MQRQAYLLVGAAIALGLVWWFFVRVPGGIEMRLEGQGKAQLTSTVNGALTQRAVDLPWSQRQALPSGTIVAFGGQLEGDGALTCVLRAGGQELQRATSNGARAVVTCAGAVP
jgi:hypothetical protein